MQPQDRSYYPSLPDERACNIWLALEDVTAESGCLAFADSPLDDPTPLRTHWPAGGGGGALQCEGPAPEAVTLAPLRAGSVTVHSARTLHWAGGNSTAAPRRGYVVQTRPAASVRTARRFGFDHGRFAGNTAEERAARGAGIVIEAPK